MMLLIFGFLMIVIFGKLIMLAIKMAWGITKILFHLIFLPLVLIGMVFGGFLHIALILLVIIGICSFVVGE